MPKAKRSSDHWAQQRRGWQSQRRERRSEYERQRDQPRPSQ